MMAIELQPLREEHIDEIYLSWFRDPEVTRYLEAKNISRQDAIQHLRYGHSSGEYRLYGIWHKADRTHIGNVKLGPINHRHRVADCVTVIGRRDYWGLGLATQAIELVKAIAFDELNLRKLSAGIMDGNTNSISAYTRAGFVIEGRLKGQYLIDGHPIDRIEIGCFNVRHFGRA